VAETVIVKTTPNVAGSTVVAEAAADITNNNIVNDINQYTVVTLRNANAAPQDVVFLTAATYLGKAVADTTVTIPASSSRIFSKLDYRLYGRDLVIDSPLTDIKIQALQP
jgi:DNA replication initiation complex subunit (GINS family)